MALAFIAFHMRDYLRDTMHLSCEQHGAYFLLLMHCWQHGKIPLDTVSLCKICKTTPQKFRATITDAVMPFFDENGENKRATAERIKAENNRVQKALAGSKGGTKKAINRASRLAGATPGTLAAARLPLDGNPSGSLAIKNRYITTTFFGAAREGLPRDGVAIPKGSLPPDFQENARTAVQQSPGIGSGELSASLQNRGWVK